MNKILAMMILGVFCVSMFSVLSNSITAESALVGDFERLTDDEVDDFGPSLCVDSNGYPHIAWVKGQANSYDVYYGRKADSSWLISKVTSLSSYSMFHISLSLDSDDTPHIAALTETNRWDLWYMSLDRPTSTWIVEPVANGGSNSHRNVVSLAVGSDGSPHIAWAARWGGGLWGVFYAVNSGSTWSIETISHDDDSAPSIALDSGNVPHVLWTHVGYLTNVRVRYASRTGGSWVGEDVPGGERGGGDNPRQITVDSFGAAHITFMKQVTLGHYELWYGNKSAESWSLSRIRDSTFENYYPSIDLGASGIPYVVWRSNDAGNYDVYLAKIVGTDWEIAQVTCETMAEGNNPGPSLCVGSANDVHIAWYASQIGSGEAEIYYNARVETVNADVDIDPDTLNLKSKGKWITAHIESLGGYDVHDINVLTLALNGTVPAETFTNGIGDYDEDGVLDLMVKFDRSAVTELIRNSIVVTERFTYVTLTVTGLLNDGTPIQGTDTIKVIIPKYEILPD